MKLLKKNLDNTLSLSLSVCAYSHVLFRPLINALLVSLLPISLGNPFIHSWRARALSLATGPWWSSAWVSELSLPWHDFRLWLGTEILLKAAVVRGHPRDHIWCRNPGIQGKPQPLPSCGLRPLTFALVLFLLLSIQDMQSINSVCSLPYGSPQIEWQGPPSN